MKRLLIIIAILILIWFGYTIVTDGFSSSVFNLEIPSYENIQTQSELMTKSLAIYNKKNNETYRDSEKALNSAIKRYKSAKSEYESLVEESVYNTYQTTSDDGNYVIGSEEQVFYPSKVAYEIEFLLTTIGVYADKEGVDITMDVLKNSNYNMSSNSIGYILCDLNFVVKGEYMNITKFIYDLEDDDELAFEIRNFSMIKEQASFKVYSVPINSETLIESNYSEILEEDDINIESDDNKLNNTNNDTLNTIEKESSNIDNAISTNSSVNNTNKVDNNLDNSVSNIDNNTVNSDVSNTNNVSKNRAKTFSNSIKK